MNARSVVYANKVTCGAREEAEVAEDRERDVRDTSRLNSLRSARRRVEEDCEREVGDPGRQNGPQRVCEELHDGVESAMTLSASGGERGRWR